MKNKKSLFIPQQLCKDIHAKIEVVDEERYDCEAKVFKNSRDVCSIHNILFFFLNGFSFFNLSVFFTVFHNFFGKFSTLKNYFFLKSEGMPSKQKSFKIKLFSLK